MDDECYQQFVTVSLCLQHQTVTICWQHEMDNERTDDCNQHIAASNKTALHSVPEKNKPLDVW